MTLIINMQSKNYKGIPTNLRSISPKPQPFSGEKILKLVIFLTLLIHSAAGIMLLLLMFNSKKMEEEKYKSQLRSIIKMETRLTNKEGILASLIIKKSMMHFLLK